MRRFELVHTIQIYCNHDIVLASNMIIEGSLRCWRGVRVRDRRGSRCVLNDYDDCILKTTHDIVQQISVDTGLIWVRNKWTELTL